MEDGVLKSRGNFFLGADQKEKFAVREMQFGVPGPHEVLVKTMACGVCGTDVHIYHGGKGSAAVEPPVVLGHEFSGIVEAVGPEVSLVKPGDHVTLDPNMYCGLCRSCRMGRKQNCENLFALGVNVNGGFAEYCLCPDTQCYKLNEDVPFDIGAMAEPLACAIHGIDRAGIRPGETVYIIGGGPIGLMMVQLAKLSGAETVILSEPIESRRKIGLEVGADLALDPIHEDIRAFLQNHIGRDSVDVVIECVGKVFATEQAFHVAGRGMKIMLFSVPEPDATFPLPLFDLYNKELTVMGSMINPDTHQRAVNLINSGKVRIDNIITHRFPLDRLEDAILAQMGTESIKVMVHPQE